MSSAAGGEDLPSPFADIPALVHDHSYLSVLFNGLVDNTLVYISGFVVRRALKKLSCDVCRASLVTDAASAIKDQSYHLLTSKKKWRSGDSIRRHSEGSRVGPSSGISKYQTITAHQTARGRVHRTEEDRVRGCVCAVWHRQPPPYTVNVSCVPVF